MRNRIKVVYDREDSIRLDKYLVDLRVQELYSRSFIEKLIEEDRVLVNNIPVKKSFLLSKGDVVDVSLPDLETSEVVPQNIPLDVVYEDDDLAVINKPAGMIVHPGYGASDQTLVNAIVFRWREDLSSGREANRPGIVHRLDRGTSGLMIIAKNDPVQSALNDMFARRQVKKTYLAITCGIPDPAEDIIESNIGRSLSNPRKMCVTPEGRWSLTRYKVIKYFHCFSLVKVALETGRMHQIRVHFAERNLPLLGDLLYNTRRQVHSIVPENLKRKVTELLTTHLMRQALHAWRLQFVQPISGRPLDIRVDPPQDFCYALAWLENYFGIDTDTRDLFSILGDNEEW
ncbi:MAG TPA: RluA family pseudouridine synthase [Candidatus Syntrophosphaera sp.]|jgi:23S rRNA pseudouridine1911/1915/1917 synthase|nr:RluA family pseudouridine synthase [Candidatus Syntrophosphaera sp.]HPH61441.1 RluA family pseudouridine synthase [Candidatus Syntrophosphaera sp.]